MNRRVAPSKNATQMCGFTLVELLVTLAIMAIVLGLAVPAFDSTIVRNRVSSQVNDFLSGLALARSEAIKRNQPVALVAKNDDWISGYTVELQSDGTVLRDYQALSGSPTFAGVGGETSFAFNPRGMLTGNNDIMELCQGPNYTGRTISITATGITNVAEKNDCP